MTFPMRSFQALVCAALVALPVGTPAAPEPPASRPPNIIVVLSDDMGFSDIGCYGGEIQTPNLDALAANGVRFTQFYNTARCCPTRASLLTGLYPHQAGIGHMMDDKGLEGYRGNLNRRCVTIAEALKPAGYRNYAVGKWHVTPGQSAKALADQHNWPLQRGFDRYYGTIHGAGSYWDPSALVRDNRQITAANDPEYRPPEFYYTDAISDHAVRFIREHTRDHPAQPFFLYVAYTAAHWPMHAKESDVAKYRGRYDAGYAAIRDARWAKQKQLGVVDARWTPGPLAGDWTQAKDRDFEVRCMEVYAAMVDCLDQGLGRVVAELKQQRQFDNTLILFLQDNGGCAETVGRGTNAAPRELRPTLPPMAPDEFQFSSTPRQTRDGWPVRMGYGVMPGGPDTYIAYGKAWANVSNTPFREYKHWVHEGGIATPLIAHWPNGIPDRGELRRQPGHLVDILATCLDVAGAKYPAELAGQPITPLEGKSLVPAFSDKPVEREAIFWEHEGNRALRNGPWKLVAKGPAGPWELYNLETDRTEMNDLAAGQPERVKDLAAKWEAWAKRANVLPWIWKPPYGTPPGPDSAEVGSAETRFELKAGDDLPRAQAPRIAGRAFTLTAEITEMAREGVLIAQGGSSEGFALYLKAGRLALATRRAGKLSVVSADEPLPLRPVKVTATLAKDGTVTLTADGRTLVSTRTPGPLVKLPVDGLQVGRDANGAVGEYPAPFPFGGRLGGVTLLLE